MKHASFLGSMLISLASAAQTEITWDDSLLVVPNIPVVVDGTTVRIGGCKHERRNVRIVIDGREVSPDSRKGREAMKEYPMDLQTAYEDIETLITGVQDSIAVLLGSDSLRIAAEREHAQWLRARDAHCSQQSDDDSETARLAYLHCMNWVSECRLNDLLREYDEILASGKP